MGGSRRSCSWMICWRGFRWSGSGRWKTPIIGGHPITLPIPMRRRSETAYGDLGLGDIVERVTNGRLSAASLS